jgi:hypothetical protein
MIMLAPLINAPVKLDVTTLQLLATIIVIVHKMNVTKLQVAIILPFLVTIRMPALRTVVILLLAAFTLL